MSGHQDGSQAGRVVHRGFQCAVGRRQKAQPDELDILWHYSMRKGAEEQMPLRCALNTLEAPVVVAMLWRWCLQCAPTVAGQLRQVVEDNDLWEHCLVPGIPVLAIVMTRSWERVIHEDPLAGPIFGIWWDPDGAQTGGNLGFPQFGFRHGDVPTGRIRVATFDGVRFRHCTTNISDGSGRVSISIVLSTKTLRAALCSQRRKRGRSPSPSTNNSIVTASTHWICVLAMAMLLMVCLHVNVY